VPGLSPAPPQPPPSATDDGIGGTVGNPNLRSDVANAKVGPWVGDTAGNVMPEPVWFAASNSTGDTATDVLEAESSQAPTVPVIDSKGARIDLTVFELLEAARAIKTPESAGDGQAPAHGSRMARAPIENSLLDAMASPATRADEAPGEARSGLLLGPALMRELPSVGTANGSRTVGAARQPGVGVGRPEPVSVIPTGGDEPLKVLWRLTSGYGQETAGVPRADTPRPGGLGESSAAPTDSVSSDGRMAPLVASQSSDGTGPKDESGYPQFARGQGETVRSVSSDGAAKFDPSLIGLARPDALAGDRIRPSAVQPGQDGGGMPTQAVFDAISDRAQVARLRGENLARFELATTDGNTIRVRIAVHDNVVSARIDVTSAAMRDVLVQHTPELSQRLQAGGLVPEVIQVSLLGGRETGSERHDRRQESGRPNGHHEIDVVNPTLIETADVGFERWA